MLCKAVIKSDAHETIGNKEKHAIHTHSIMVLNIICIRIVCRDFCLANDAYISSYVRAIILCVWLTTRHRFGRNANLIQQYNNKIFVYFV